jgi:hypothetical protein
VKFLGVEVGVESCLLHHLGGLALEAFEQLNLSFAVVGLLFLLFFDEEDVIVALADERVLDLFSLQSQQDLVLL